MSFHYGYEKRKFDKEWTRLEQEYRAADMSDTQIAAMRENDWSWPQSSPPRASVQQAISRQIYNTKANSADFTWVDAVLRQYRRSSGCNGFYQVHPYMEFAHCLTDDGNQPVGDGAVGK